MTVGLTQMRRLFLLAVSYRSTDCGFGGNSHIVDNQSTVGPVGSSNAYLMHHCQLLSSRLQSRVCSWSSARSQAYMCGQNANNELAAGSLQQVRWFDGKIQHKAVTNTHRTFTRSPPRYAAVLQPCFFFMGALPAQHCIPVWKAPPALDHIPVRLSESQYVCP
jgi:hypothetical protein